MSLISELYKLQKKDIKKAANVLANAFYDDPIYNKMEIGEDKRRIISELMIRFSFRYGNVVSTSENLEGIMAITPHDKPMTFLRIIRSGAFIVSMKLVSLRKMMGAVEKAMEEAKKSLNLEPYIYLFIIGVSQEFQGKGFGGKLLRAIVEKADIERKPMYLETQNEKNVSLYEKYGFHVVKKIDLPDPLNLSMWLMVRDAK